MRRFVRQGDFRASDSGSFSHDPGKIDIGEVSYGFMMDAYDACPGYWDIQLDWHPGHFDAQGWMLENLVSGS